MEGKISTVNSSQWISIFGLGKLGAPFGACLAAKGFQVIGVDIDDEKIRSVNEGRPPVFEPGLEELMRASGARFRATRNYEDAVWSSNVTFILLPTPSEKDGGFSLSHVLPACTRIGGALRHKAAFHLVVLTSTVLPGSTEGEVKRTLEENAGAACGESFGLCYSPEFVALGSVIRDLLNPDFVLIGESDRRSGDLLVSLYRNLCENDPPIVRMGLVNAEVTKLALNTFVTTKITFANMLARICERLPGADVDVVTSALSLDSRIGGKYLKGAIGYGGPCFPRDNLALAFLGRKLGTEATLAEATEHANRHEGVRLAKLVKSKLSAGGKVGILGLAYKPNTDVVEESQGILLAQALLAESVPVCLYDPVAVENARKLLAESAVFSASVEECVQFADVLVIATPWEEFTRLSPAVLNGDGSRRVVIDCWRLLDHSAYGGTVEYIPVGVGATVKNQ
jgi:UDPglucose 6-dehydrogenase